MKALSLIAFAQLVFFSAQAEIINNTIDNLNSCSMAAVYKAGKEFSAYTGPNEPIFELTEVKKTSENQYGMQFDVILNMVFDGDSPSGGKYETNVSVLTTSDGECSLPNLGWPLMIGKKAPQNKCLTRNNNNGLLWTCNQNLKGYVSALGFEDYYDRYKLDSDTDLAQLLFKRAEDQINKGWGYQYDFKNGGEWVLYEVYEYHTDEKYLAVYWLDIDDNSAAVFFEREFPLNFLYSTYEN